MSLENAGAGSRRYHDVYDAKRRAAGYSTVTAWLQPYALRRLDELALVYGSRTAAIEAAVLALGLPEEEE